MFYVTYYVLYNVSRVQRFCLTDFVSGNETDEKRNRADSHVRLHYRCLLLFEIFASNCSVLVLLRRRKDSFE